MNITYCLLLWDDVYTIGVSEAIADCIFGLYPGDRRRVFLPKVDIYVPYLAVSYPKRQY